MKSGKKITLGMMKRVWAVLLAIIVLVTTTSIGELKLDVFAANGDGSAGSPYVLGDSSNSSTDVKPIRINSKTGDPVDITSSYDANSTFWAELSFGLTAEVLKEIKNTFNTTQTSKIYFTYSIPDSVLPKNVNNEIMEGSIGLGTYKIDGNIVTFTIEKDFFYDQYDPINGQFKDQNVNLGFGFSFTAKEDRIDDQDKLNLAFPGAANTPTIPYKGSDATGYKSAGTETVDAEGKIHIPYSFSITTNSRTSGKIEITDTPGANLQADIDSIKIMQGNTVLTKDTDYSVVPNGSNGFTIEITASGTKFPANTHFDLTYEATVKDANDLDASGNIKDINNTITWEVDDHQNDNNKSTAYKTIQPANIQMGKNGVVVGDEIQWTVTINNGAIKSDLAGLKFEDTMIVESYQNVTDPITFEIVANSIKMDGNILPVEYVLTMGSDEKSFNIQFPPTSDKNSHTFTYTSKLTSPTQLKNGDSITLKNTSELLDGNIVKGHTTANGQINENYNLNVAKVANGSYDMATNTQKWTSTITPDAQDALVNPVFYDELRTSNSGFDGHIFVENSVEIKYDNQTLSTIPNAAGQYYTITYSKSENNTIGNDKMQIHFTGSFDKPITISYASFDDGTISSNKNLINYCYVNDPQYSATVYSWMPQVSQAEGMAKIGAFTDATHTSANWKIIVNADSEGARVGAKTLDSTASIVITDILPVGAEIYMDNGNLDLSKITLTYFNGDNTGTYDGYDLKTLLQEKGYQLALCITYDTSTRKLTVTIPADLLTADKTKNSAGYPLWNETGVSAKPIIHIAYSTATNTYLEMENNASYTNGNNSGSAKYKLTQSENLLNKTQANDDTKLYYTIDVNPLALDYTSGTIMEIKDTMPTNANLLIDTLKVVDAAGNDLIANGTVKYNYNTNDRTLAFSIPDNMHLVITYSMSPDFTGLTPDANGYYTITPVNDVVYTANPLDEKSRTSTPARMQESSAWIEGENDAEHYTLNLRKVDAEDLTNKISGAQFNFMAFDVPTKTFTNVQLNDSNENVIGIKITNASGIIQLKGLRYDTIYSYQEVAAPSGYVRDNTIHYFMVVKDTSVSTVAKTAFTAAGLNVAQISSIRAGSIVTVTNEKGNTPVSKVNIDKVDENGNPVPGAVLEIWEDGANQVYQFDPADSSTKCHYTTNGARITVTGLPAGNYVLKEITAPNGYELAADKPFTVVAGETVNVEMIDKLVQVSFAKMSLSNGVQSSLAGAKLQLTTNTGTVVKSWTSTTEVYTVSGLIAGQKYVLHEVEAPILHKLADDIYFIVQEDGTIVRYLDNTYATSLLPKTEDALAIPVITMVDEKTTSTLIYKYDENNQYLAGAQLKVYKADSDGNLNYESGAITNEIAKDGVGNDVQITTTNDVWNVVGLIAGQTYYLVEVQAPNGYEVANPIKFVVNANEPTTVTMKDYQTQPATLKIDKVDQDEQPVVGAVLQLLDEFGRQIKIGGVVATKPNSNEYLYQYTTNGTQIVINGLAPGKYIIREISAPDGYTVAQDVPVNLVSGDTQTIKVTDTHLKASIEILKVDETNTGLPDAELAIYEAVKNANGNYVVARDAQGNEKTPLASGATGDSGIWSISETDVETAGIVVGRTYILREITAPSGYELADDIVITIVSGQNRFTMTDRSITPDTSFQIVKQDMQGNILSGAELCISTTSTDAGSIALYADGTNTYTKTNNGSTAVPSFTSALAATTIKNLPEGTYYLVEKTAPTGYQKSNSIMFHVDAEGKISYAAYGQSFNGVSLIVMKDDTVPFQVLKVNSSQQPLTGATLAIYNATGNTIIKAVYDASTHTYNYDRETPTNNNAEIKWDSSTAFTIKGLPVGNYVLKEIKAPNGYKLSEDIHFTVNADGTVTYSYRGTSYNRVSVIKMQDDNTTITVNKVDENGNPVVGASLVVSEDASGSNPVASWQTDSTGSKVLTGLSSNKVYYLVETNQLTGYELATTIQFRLRVDGTIEIYDASTSTYIPTGSAVLQMVDISAAAATANVTILKVDENNLPIEGAKLQLQVYDNGSYIALKGRVEENKITIDSAETGIVEWTSNTSVFYINNLPAGSYKLVEVVAPTGYSKAADIEFQVGQDLLIKDAQGNVISNKRITMKDYPTSLTIQKTDENGYGLAGAQFRIYEDLVNTGAQYHGLNSEKPVTEFTSTATPNVISGKIEPSTADSLKWYVLKEISAPSGYVLLENPICFWMDEAGNITYGTLTSNGLGTLTVGHSIVVKNTKTSITVEKRSDATGNPLLSGAELAIIDNNLGTVVASWTSTQGAKTITGLVVGKTYILREINAPLGYDIADDIVFTMNADGTAKVGNNNLTNIIMIDTGITYVSIHKVTTAGIPLANAQLKLFRATLKNGAQAGSTQVLDYNIGNQVASWTSDSTAPKEFMGQLEPGTYILRETAAPKGYEIADDMVVVVKPAGERSDDVIMIDRMSNDFYNTLATFTKVDQYGNMVSGATLEIYKALTPDGQTYTDTTFAQPYKLGDRVTSWVTNGNVHIEKDLLEGMVYVLHEANAPDGFDKASDQLFCIKTYTIQVDLTMIDYRKPTEPPTPNYKTMSISKQDIAGSGEIPGATLTLYSGTTASGTPVFSWISGNTPRKIAIGENTYVSGDQVVLAAGTYTLKETGAPAGYAYAEDITFSVDIDGKIKLLDADGELAEDGTLIMRDEAIRTYVSKVELGAGKEIAGAKISLYRGSEYGLSGVSPVETWISETNAHIIQTQLQAGAEYVLVEELAPEGYKILETVIRFRVNEDGSITLVGSYSEDETGTKKYAETDSVTNQIIIKNELLTKTNTGTSSSDTSSSSVKTGDNNKLALWISLMVAGIGICLYSVFGYKKKSKKRK